MVSPDMLTVGGLCSGIGGLELGLERAGMRTIWHAETDPYAARVLAKHWPHVPNLGDITTIDWSTVDRPDLVCGGYPCQPFSYAGTRQGEDDPRHLWPHVARAIGVLRPRWALLENVPGHLTLGFGTVLADLAALGYDCEWESIPAASVGAPHLRWRIFVVAHAHGEGQPRRAVNEEPRSGQLVPDADSEPLRVRTGGIPPSSRAPEGAGDQRQRVRTDTRHVRETVADADSPRCPDVFGSATLTGLTRRRAVSGASWWDAEPDVGRVADGVPARVDRLRCLGNAVVPQVAEWVGRQILEADIS